MITRILTRLFGKPEEINGHGRCPTYLYRWRVFRFRGIALYVHRLVGDDWSRDLHDHPKRFVTLMVAGGYTEETPKGRREFSAPWLRSFPASWRHRVFLGRYRECWTLVLVWAAVRPWGFWHNGRWIHWREYVSGRSAGIADRMRTCAGSDV